MFAFISEQWSYFQFLRKASFSANNKCANSASMRLVFMRILNFNDNSRYTFYQSLIVVWSYNREYIILLASIKLMCIYELIYIQTICCSAIVAIETLIHLINKCDLLCIRIGTHTYQYSTLTCVWSFWCLENIKKDCPVFRTSERYGSLVDSYNLLYKFHTIQVLLH